MPKCSGCEESGHTFRDCPKRGCETCGESTHRRYECRARVIPQRNSVVDIVSIGRIEVL